jgi:hypothetical protein
MLFACDVLFVGLKLVLSDLMHWCGLLALNALACFVLQNTRRLSKQ